VWLVKSYETFVCYGALARLSFQAVSVALDYHSKTSGYQWIIRVKITPRNSRNLRKATGNHLSTGPQHHDRPGREKPTFGQNASFPFTSLACEVLLCPSSSPQYPPTTCCRVRSSGYCHSFNFAILGFAYFSDRWAIQGNSYTSSYYPQRWWSWNGNDIRTLTGWLMCAIEYIVDIVQLTTHRLYIDTHDVFARTVILDK